MGNREGQVETGWSQVPIFSILLFDAAALIARSFLEVKLRDRGYDLNLASDLSFLVVPPILLLLMYPVLKKHGSLMPPLFDRRRLTLRILAIGIALGLTLRLASWGALISMTAFRIKVAEDLQAPIGPGFYWNCPPTWQLGLGILVTVLAIPLIEEAINRGFFLNRLLDRGRIFAVVSSAVLFAILHNPQTVTFAFVAGIFFAVAALNSGALWASIIAHASYNLAALIDWRCLNGHWNPREVSSVTIGAGAMATGLMLVSLVLGCLLISKRAIGPPIGAR